MDTSVTTPPYPIMRNPERVAWGVLLVAFAIFCTTCILSTLAVYWFFFQSTVPMHVVAQATRATFGLTRADLSESLIRQNFDGIVVGNVVRPSDASAQTTIAVRDPNRDDRVVAMFTLKGNTSSATVRMAESPRFEWGNTPYQIVFQVEGNVDVLVAQDLTRPFSLNLFAKGGAQINLGKPGLYTINASENSLILTTQVGEAVLTAPGELIGFPVPAGTSREIVRGSKEAIQIKPPLNLLTNPNLQVDPPLPEDGQQIAVVAPTGWGCGHNNAVGNWERVMPQGRTFALLQDGHETLRLVRGEDADQNGQTYCHQGPESGRVWHDISQYNSLVLRTTFNIASQSLAACGTTEEATECPFMIVIYYLDANGERRELVFGFYARLDDTRQLKNRCPACHQDHIFVHPGSWYTYESGNLLDLPLPSPPSAISQIKFYASGHQYDVRVSEVSLLVSSTTPPAETETNGASN